MKALLRRSAVHLVLALAALAVVLPLTPPDSTGVQADNLVLGLIAGAASVRAFRLTRGMTGRAALPWRLMGWAAALFGISGVLTGSGLAGAYGASGAGDLLLFLALGIPPAVCAVLARQARISGWPGLLVDGLSVVLALIVVEDVLLFSAPDRPAALDPLTIGYAGYGAVAVGLAGALCTITTRESSRSATAMIVANVCLALAAAMLAVGLDRPVLLWQALGDVAVVLCLEAGVLAVAAAPHRSSSPADIAAGSSRVNAVGLLISVSALVGVPVVLLLAVARGQRLSPWSVALIAVVVLLLLARSTLRVRAGSRLVAELVRSEEDLRDLVEGSSDGIAIIDGVLRLQFTSPAARSLLGLPADGGTTQTLPELIHPGDRERALHELRDGTGAPLHVRIVRAAGETTELEVTHHQRGAERYVLHLRDATVRRRRERELERMAYTDHLTRLPNRALLFQEMAAVTAVRSLLVLDLDGFKAVNDVAGHESGDQLLVEVGSRLRTVVRDRDVVCRLGGDEFAVVVEGGLTEAVEAAERMVDVLSHPYRTGEWTFAIGASVGVAELRPGGGQLAFREADAALRAAKQAGKGCVRVWDGGTGAANVDADVVRALAAGQIELRYSVGRDAVSGRCVLHAKPFWAHPSGTLLAPGELWAASGRQGCDAALQRWVLGEAARQGAALPGVSLVAVDLLAGHVQPDHLVQDVSGALASSGLLGSQLSVVLTEEALFTSAASLVPALHELRASDVRICLADFGMGQSLYSHLARVPLTSIRVDVSALGGRDDDEHTIKVVRSIVGAAQNFGLATIAHGVEPGPLRDAVLACGVRMVSTRDEMEYLTLDLVRAHVRGDDPAPAEATALDDDRASGGPRILTG